MSVDNPEFRTSSPEIYLLLKENARKNRANMTEAEKMLWDVSDATRALFVSEDNISLAITL